MGRVFLGLVIHSHQPVGNFEHVLEEAYRKSYEPFVRGLLQHPRIRVSLHFSGSLLEWIEKAHPEYFDRLRELLARDQIELVGGGFYEPILPSIPDADKSVQIGRMADYLLKRFRSKPQGAWVAERVWEPGLAQPLAEAGVRYTILDDTHFLAAGLEPAELRGVYITEALGDALTLVPSLKSLRYTIPFREPHETIEILRQGMGQQGALFAVGDDCEKFGVWPGTYDHCYKNGWLERFFAALESSGDWLETTRVSDYLATHPPLGRIYLPAAAYAEMMEWALPTNAARQFHQCLEESERLPFGERFLRFLRGGLWQNFLSKYAEANQLHKLMLEVSRRWHAAARRPATAPERARSLEQAQTHLLAGQCNDAYWHGIFGGLYAPHLRSGVERNLIQAEALLDRIEGRSDTPRVARRDFDVDGRDEVLIEHPGFSLIVKPSDGGTVSSLRFKPADVELINALRRRPEAYHDIVRRNVETRQAPVEGPASIHDRVWSKESKLDALLRYDRYDRHCFRDFLFPAHKTWQDYEQLRLEEHGELAGGAWEAVSEAGATVVMRKRIAVRGEHGDFAVEAEKSLRARFADGACEFECITRLAAEQVPGVSFAGGVEVVFNLLAPNAPDRYFLANGTKQPLEFCGEIESPSLELVDEWQRLKIRLDGGPQTRWWIAPIETISQSESGFERVYQGSAILAVWPLPVAQWGALRFSLRVAVASLNRG